MNNNNYYEDLPDKSDVFGKRDKQNTSAHDPKKKMLDITRDKPIKVAVKVVVPVKDHPKFNFVGKLLGPKGNSLKRLQEDTMCKMAVLGRGSMRDRQKEAELRSSGDPKFGHLAEDLHVEISAFATPAEAHARIAYALAEVRRFLVPDYNDEIRQEQMLEMQSLKTRNSNEESTMKQMNRGTGGMTGTSEDSDVKPDSVNQRLGRKRPFILSNNLTSMTPTKRTVLGLLARARACQSGSTSSAVRQERLLVQDFIAAGTLI